MATLAPWSPRFRSKVFKNRDMFESLINAIQNDPLIDNKAPGIDRYVSRTSQLSYSTSSYRLMILILLIIKFFRLFFAHLKTTISFITVYLNEKVTDYRAIDFPQSDFKRMVLAYRNAKTAQKQTKEPTKEPKTRSQKNVQAAEASSSAQKSQALQFIEDLDMTLEIFEKRCTQVVQKMSGNKSYKTYEIRMHNDFELRLIATSGLSWNLGSKNQTRDYLLAASAAVLETHFVPLYRPDLLTNCMGAGILRKELQDYLMSIAKLIHINVPADKNAGEEVETERTTMQGWEFPDRLESEAKTLKLGYSEQDVDAIVSKLTRSNADAKENEEILRIINKLVKCPLLWCTKKGVAKGTLETLAYRLIMGLSDVGGM